MVSRVTSRTRTINTNNSSIICLQETNVNNIHDNVTSFKQFTTYQKLGKIDNENRGHGGVMILVKNSIAQTNIPLTTPLQATASRVTLTKSITICNIYIPPHDDVNINTIQNLILQLPEPFIIVGDFNAHNEIWGAKNTNEKGKRIENIILNNNLCLYNDGTSTYLHPASGTFTPIDLSLSSPSIFTDFAWSVEDDQWGSDHFPIILKETTPSNEYKHEKWQFHKADWKEFHNLCLQNINLSTRFPEETDKIDQITEKNIDISKQCIPISKGNYNPQKPWFNNHCKSLVKERKKALKQYKKYPSQFNLQKYRLARAKARQALKSKSDSWQRYISKLNNKIPLK